MNFIAVNQEQIMKKVMLSALLLSLPLNGLRAGTVYSPEAAASAFATAR